MYWKKPVSCVYAYLTIRDSGCLCSRLSFQNSLRRQRQCLPPEQRAGMLSVQYNKDSISFQNKGKACLLLIIKDSVFLISRLPPCYTTHCMCKYHLAFFCLLGIETQENSAKNLLIFRPLLLLQKINSFVSDAGVSDLLPTSMKLWQATFLGCKQAKTTDLHSSWHYCASQNLQYKGDLQALLASS